MPVLATEWFLGGHSHHQPPPANVQKSVRGRTSQVQTPDDGPRQDRTTSHLLSTRVTGVETTGKFGSDRVSSPSQYLVLLPLFPGGDGSRRDDRTHQVDLGSGRGVGSYCRKRLSGAEETPIKPPVYNRNLDQGSQGRRGIRRRGSRGPSPRPVRTGDLDDVETSQVTGAFGRGPGTRG